MNRVQWAYSLFDAGSWGYASVTLSTLAPLVFVHRMKTAANQQLVILHDLQMMHRIQLADGNATDVMEEFPGMDGTPMPLEEIEENGPAAIFNGIDPKHASSAWVFTVAVSTLAAGILCPILGALADRYAARKFTTFFWAAMSVVFTTMFAFTSGESPWIEILGLVGFAMMSTSVMHCFYNSLLLLISESHNIVKVACLQCFIGSVGTTILMVSLNMHDLERDKVTERGYVLYCFCLAAVWFVALSIPLWIWLEEDEATQTNTLEESFAQSWKDTLRSLKNFELVKYLVALMLFNDANTTLHIVYVVYAAQIGLPAEKIMAGAVLNRIISAVASLMWLGLSTLLDPKSCFIGCILSTLVAIVLCAWMDNIVDFYLMVAFMTTASAGSFIFSKVLMGALTPREKASHNFGFMGMVNRVGGFIGPFAFSILSVIYGPKSGFVVLLVMAVTGLLVITQVDFEAGYKVSTAKP